MQAYYSKEFDCKKKNTNGVIQSNFALVPYRVHFCGFYMQFKQLSSRHVV